jgi:hypothetical protein
MINTFDYQTDNGIDITTNAGAVSIKNYTHLTVYGSTSGTTSSSTGAGVGQSVGVTATLTMIKNSFI